MFSKQFFLKKIPSGFRKRKFIPLEPLILPLDTKKNFEFKNSKADWLIEQVEELDSLYLHQLVFPQNNRFNPQEISFHKPKLTTLFHCRPDDPESSIEHVIIGLHENYVLSLMAMPKEGTSMKLCRALSGRELSDLKQAHDPLPPFSFHFSFKAGADPRARASLVVRCDDYLEVKRLESFLGGINQVVPLNQELINLASCIIDHSKKTISFAQNKDELIRKRKSLTLPQNIIQATYSEKIKDGIAQYNHNIKRVEEQSSWPKSFDFPKKRKLNLFSGYPNGIPDLQRQKKIITCYPLFINHFPAVIPEIHLAILSNDHDRFKKIVSDNPMVIYARDCFGHLPIELAYQLLNPEIGEHLYDIWEKLPKSQQWSTQVFVETANKLSTLEFSYGSVTADDIQQCVNNYFKDSLPMIDKPLDIYKAVISNDQQTLNHLVQQETAVWHLLKQYCLVGKGQEARGVLAQVISAKHAIFAAALRQSYPDILIAINDYLPDIAALDRSILDGHRENTRALREESFIMEWKALQQAIDDASGIPDINAKMDDVISQINSLKDPLFGDRGVLDELNNQLWKLHVEKNLNLAKYNNLREKISDSQWTLKHDLGKDLAYLEWLKKKIRDATGQAEDEEGLKISSEIITNELMVFSKIHSAIQTGDDDNLKQLISSECNDATGRAPILGYRFLYKNPYAESIYQTMFDGKFMPDHFELYLSLFNNDLNSALDYIERHLQQKEDVICCIKTIRQARCYFDTRFPKRLDKHKQIINGDMPPIQQYMEEKQYFDEYKEHLKSIFKEECKLLNTLLCSIKKNQEDLTFIKIINPDIRIKHSLIKLATLYVDTIIINSEEMTLQKKAFEDNFTAYINNETEKEILLKIWQNIAAIKQQSLDNIKQCTEDYRQHSLCSDKQVFDVYTLTLIFQQASIVYQNILNTKRSQQFNLSLIHSIKQSIQGKSWQERAKFTALDNCRNVGGYFDKLLDSVIQSSLLSYEYQDPWGYTPLLLAVLNNHIDIVRMFFEKGLVSSWIMPLASDNFLYYTLLSHSHSRAMTDLLLHYFTDPDTTFSCQEGLENSLPVLLMFHHDQQQCLDTHNQSLLDYIASGQPWDHSYLDTLLLHRDVHVQAGPYDETMPEAVQTAFKKHNTRISRRIAANELKPKIVTAYGLFQDAGIRSCFKMANQEAYYSVLKKAEHLTLKEKDNLALLFATTFKHPDDAEAYERSIEFFNSKVLTNKEYIFELFYQHKGGASIGFFCFQVKLATHPDFGQSLLVHLSLAGCDTDFADKGLLGTSFRAMLALKKCSEDAGIPLVCYGRFGRPGIAYTMIPAEAVSSPKYHFSTEYIQFVAGAFGNAIEADGSSIPPVYSRAKLNNMRHGQLDEYNYLLDERIHAKDTASLPVIFEVDDKLAKIWHKKLGDSMGITEHHVQHLYEQIKPWILDDEIMPNNTCGC